MSFVKLLWYGPGSAVSRVLVLFIFCSFHATTVRSTCPHCYGNFASCTWDSSKTCPTVTVVTANAGIIAGTTAGVLTLATIVKSKFLRPFSKTSLSSLLTLFKRPSPGTPFVIDAATKGSAILSAVSFGQLSVESALFQLSDLLEAAADDTAKILIKGRIDTLKVLQPRVNQEGANFMPVSLGVFSFIWAKVSEYVMCHGNLDRVSVDARDAASGTGSSTASSFSARIFRPKFMHQFAEMINMFTMVCHGLAIASCMLLTEFFATAVYEGIRVRGDSWQLSHEIMLIMFRRVEDSDGRIHLGSVFDDIYLNSIVEEAKARVSTFFRIGAGDAREDGVTNGVTNGVTYNGSFTASGRPCPHFNREDPKKPGFSSPHPKDSLKPDGTCKFNHVCNKWVSDKGKAGRCLCTAGTAGHPRFKCDNPNRCNDCVE